MASLFESLRHGDERGLHAAIETMAARMTSWAKGELRKRGINARSDLQPESLVQSVMAGGFERILRNAKDPEHFEATIRLALKHKLIDRLKRGGAMGPVRAFADFREEAENAMAALPTNGPRFEADLDAHKEFAKFDRFHRALTGADGLDATQWKILEDHLVHERSLGDIANDLGIQREAAKQRYATIRRRALALVHGHIARGLSTIAKMVAQKAFLDRADLDAISGATGLSEADVVFTLADEIVPAIVAQYGTAGAQVVAGLLGSRHAA
ncbi:MAG: sigma-70 family RNA polymerase sigma factor [Phycisphaerae bacterium]|nr:sigma-70 family RNA polymerase sigma factor [Phycisphaerae bacterium]